MRTRHLYIDVLDQDDGGKDFHVCDGGQTIAVVSESLFEDIGEARMWANAIVKALNEYTINNDITTVIR